MWMKREKLSPQMALWEQGDHPEVDGCPDIRLYIWRREIYEKFGLYKEDYKCAADYEFMVRILKMGPRSCLISLNR